MRERYEGGCQCGALRYVVNAEPKMIYACHCTQCQRQSSSAFGMAVVFGGGDITTTGVEPHSYVRDGKGRKVRGFFCPGMWDAGVPPVVYGRGSTPLFQPQAGNPRRH